MKRILTLLLCTLAAAVAGAACGAADETPSPGHREHTLASGDAGAAVVRDVGDHKGVGVMRCERCHTPEDRKHPEWKNKAMALGHDVARTFEDHTTCQCCHLGEVKGFGEPLDRKCAECHENIRVTITAMGKMHCLSCHDPTASGGMAIRESAWECKKCHSKDQGDKPAIDVHSGEDCSNCHRPHQEPWTLPRPCTDCHVGHETWHGASEPSKDRDGGAPDHADAGAHLKPPTAFTGEPTACSVCHKPHEVSGRASDRCFACHTKREPTVFTAATTFAGGHERCTTCHTPHGDLAKAGPRECRTCHTAVVTMSGKASEAHSKCINCHKPHDVRATPRSACIGCHLSVKPDHPDPKNLNCTGCHEPHPGNKGRAVVPPNKNALLAAMEAAKDLNKFPKAPSPVKCGQCHTKAATETAFHDGKTTCKNCHAPHSFTAATGAGCATCHAKQNAAATAAAGHGHGKCKTCHEVHNPKAAKPACGSCHEAELKTAPAGHADCRKCHDAHPDKRAPKAQCTTCHEKKKTGPHGPVACASCHRAHGPDAPVGPPGAAAVPDCVSCHTQAKLVGMHAVTSHGTCSNCHGGHKPPSSDRATCTSGSCHANKKEHEPTAKVCSGCHVFTKGR